MDSQRNIAAAFIATIGTHNTGGNFRADVIELKSGLALVLSDETPLALYPSAEAFIENTAAAWEHIPLMQGSDEGFARTSGDVSACGLTFVDHIESDRATLDILHLADGRVIGIDGDEAVLFPDARHLADAIEGHYPFLELRENETAVDVCPACRPGEAAPHFRYNCRGCGAKGGAQ